MNSPSPNPVDPNPVNATESVVTLTVPGRPEYVRLARLAAADAGSRAGLSIDEVDDLRIAVDELAHALIGEGGIEGDLTLRFALAFGLVEIEGSCPALGEAVEVSELSRTVISAVADEHEIEERDGARRFRLVKRVRS